MTTENKTERLPRIGWMRLLGHNVQMKIDHIISELGNDFMALMQCEYCGHTQKLSSGYHDNFYHTRVIPAMTCQKCGKNRAGEVPETKNDHGTAHVA